GLKGPVTVAQQDGHRYRKIIGHGKVEDAVASQVCYCQGGGAVADGVIDSVAEGAVALSQQNADRVGAVVRHGEIGEMVAVEVAYRHRLRQSAHGVALGSPKRTVAVA